jgi:hypothetical protein
MKSNKRAIYKYLQDLNLLSWHSILLVSCMNFFDQEIPKQGYTSTHAQIFVPDGGDMQLALHSNYLFQGKVILLPIT